MKKINPTNKIHGELRRLGMALLILVLAAGALPAAAGAYYGHHYGYHGYGHHYGYGRYYGHHYGYGYYPYGQVSPYQLHQSARLAQQSGLGGLDLKVKPKKTKVYVDGEYVGVTGDFDGYPSYLWLEKGTHQVAFYNEGYLTVEQELTVRPGLLTKLKLRLQPGESVPPDELAAEAR